uniref:Uncharacterized protein n=1 Tax=viral metagenome TaxID=1070528 RepID=A0A6H1ZYI7_9ZZZZ
MVELKLEHDLQNKSIPDIKSEHLKITETIFTKVGEGTETRFIELRRTKRSEIVTKSLSSHGQTVLKNIKVEASLPMDIIIEWVIKYYDKTESRSINVFHLNQAIDFEEARKLKHFGKQFKGE